MNLPEKIAGAYLRLNGFFLMPHFTVFDQQTYSHIDFLGIRPINSREQIETDIGVFELPLDTELFEAISRRLARSFNDISLGAIVEVKGNQTIEIPSVEHIQYATRILGNDIHIIPISFSNKIDNIGDDKDTLVIGIKYAMDWIFERFQWMDDNLPRLTKTGSWFLSEDALSDMIYLYKIRQEGD